jgi:hypothetical protein
MSSRAQKMDDWSGFHHREFVLARLQKAQSSESRQIDLPKRGFPRIN